MRNERPFRAGISRLPFGVILVTILGCTSDAPPPEDVPTTILNERDTPTALLVDTIAIVGGLKEQQPGHALSRVVDALLLESGELIVATETSQSLLYFDKDGTFVREVGRFGQGPGEFQRIRSLHWLGSDTIAGWDATLGRITVFSPTGAVSTVTLSTQGSAAPRLRRPDNRPLDVYNSGASGFVTVSSPRRIEPAPGLSRDSLQVSLVDRSGHVIREIGTLPGDQHYRGRETLRALFNYRFYAATTDSVLYVASGRGADLMEYRLSDGSARRIVLPINRQPMSARDRSHEIERFVTESFSPRDREVMRETLEKGSVVDSFPAVTDLQTGTDGALWVRLYAPPDEPRQWLIVDLATEAIRRVELPPRSRLLAATADKIAVLTTDAFGREEVLVCGLRPQT